MNLAAKLTPRELEIVEYIAWGAAKKDIADLLCISVFTVDNTIKSALGKTECHKSTELCVWFFCRRFNISLDLSPLRRKVITIVMLGMLLPQLTMDVSSINARVRRARRGRRNEVELIIA